MNNPTVATVASDDSLATSFEPMPDADADALCTSCGVNVSIRSACTGKLRATDCLAWCASCNVWSESDALSIDERG